MLLARAAAAGALARAHGGGVLEEEAAGAGAASRFWRNAACCCAVRSVIGMATSTRNGLNCDLIKWMGSTCNGLWQTSPSMMITELMPL